MTAPRAFICHSYGTCSSPAVHVGLGGIPRCSAHLSTCPECNGLGEVLQNAEKRARLGLQPKLVTCGHCSGDGVA